MNALAKPNSFSVWNSAKRDEHAKHGPLLHSTIILFTKHGFGPLSESCRTRPARTFALSPITSPEFHNFVLGLASKSAKRMSFKTQMLLSQPPLQREGDARAHGCVFHGRKMRGVATNIYSRKTSKKPKRVVYKL